MTPELQERLTDLVPQARSEAWKVFQTAPQTLDRDELTSLALLGLAQAAERWPVYCEKNGYSPDALEYFAAYALRRIRGAMLDYLRSQDWLSRAMRGRAKALRDAGMDTGVSEAELARRTGLTIAQVRETQAALARRPVSVDAEPVDLTEPGDVESAAMVSVVLDAVVTALRGQGPEITVIIALRYYRGWELADIAPLLGRGLDEVRRFHDQGVLAVHQAMAAAATESQV